MERTAPNVPTAMKNLLEACHFPCQDWCSIRITTFYLVKTACSNYLLSQHVFFTDGGPTVAGTNPAVVAVFARALTTFSQHVYASACATPT